MEEVRKEKVAKLKVEITVNLEIIARFGGFVIYVLHLFYCILYCLCIMFLEIY
jgi:hypothetical protein